MLLKYPKNFVFQLFAWFVTCVEAIIYFLLYNLHVFTFKVFLLQVLVSALSSLQAEFSYSVVGLIAFPFHVFSNISLSFHHVYLYPTKKSSINLLLPNYLAHILYQPKHLFLVNPFVSNTQRVH